MRCEILGVGTELLLGQIVNTNAAWIGSRLADVGWDCLRHTVVGDNEGRIVDALREALDRAHAVIVTGGLGPTQDDITREAIAVVAGVPLERRPELEAAIRERFASFGGTLPEMNLRQADVPAGGRHIDNPRGSAPGVMVEVDGKPIYALPGVPWEMQHMVEAFVLPDLAQRAGEGRAIVSRVLRTAGVGESRLAERLTRLWDAATGPVTLAYLAGAGEVRIRLTAVADSRGEALGLIAPMERAVRAELGSVVYAADEETLERLVGRLLEESKRTLAVAESLTGGLVGGRLTSVPGSSGWFRGAVVAYATELKHSVLGVDQALLVAPGPGPVSEPVAAAMAAGVRRALGADVGLATTGVAGPGPADGVPAGTVCLGVADADGSAAISSRAPGDRAQVRAWVTTLALDLARRRLQGEPLLGRLDPTRTAR